MDLEGRVALVTGGSRGIGRGICLALARRGADVVINDNERPDAARAVLREIEQIGRAGLVVQADVASQPDVDRMMNATLDRFDALHIMVNNAGICPFHDFLSMPVELWDRVHAVNLRGTFLRSQAAAPIMIERGIKGRIVSISAISAKVGSAMQCHYTPTKSGQESLMRSMAIVLGPYRITCNSVAPEQSKRTSTSTICPIPPSARTWSRARPPEGRECPRASAVPWGFSHTTKPRT